MTGLQPLKEMAVGSVRTLIVRGTRDEIESQLSDFEPLFLDFIPLTLEEIFIYEIGGQGYEVSNILL